MVNAWHDVEIGKDAPKVVNAIVEIPKGSRVKYELDKKTGMIKMDRFMFSAMHYPGDYGFLPRTYWEDDDPLDVVILTGEPLLPGTIAEVRVIGVLHMTDGGEGDDKIIAVYEKDPRYKKINSVKDLQEHYVEEIKHFFETYKELEKKEVKVTGVDGKEEAYKAVEKGRKLYDEKFSN